MRQLEKAECLAALLPLKQPWTTRLKPDAPLDHKASMVCNTAVNLCKAFPWTGSQLKTFQEEPVGGGLFFLLMGLAECFLDRMEAAGIAQ